MTKFEQYLHIMDLSKNYMQLSKLELKTELESLNDNLKTFQILGHFEAFNMTLNNIQAIKILLDGVSYTFITHEVPFDMYTDMCNNWNYRKFSKLKSVGA